MNESETGKARLAGRRVLVTGGTAGIGAAVVKVCMTGGAQTGFLGRDATRLASVAAETGAVGVSADLRKPASVRAAVESLAETMSGIDALINCAGVMLHSRVSEGRTSDWEESIGVNLLGVLNAVHASLPYLSQAGFADIVNICSASADRLNAAEFAVYAATKSAVRKLTEGLRLELRDQNIRVSLVTPSFVRTEGLGPGIHDPELRKSTVETKERIGMPPTFVAAEICRLISLPRYAGVVEISLAPFPGQ